MIAISSFRPFGQDPEWDTNQTTAHATWQKVFSKIIYLNDREPALESENTVFMGGNEHPTIKSLCQIAAVQDEWACIINADIQVAPKFIEIEALALKHDAKALVSYRWQLENGEHKVIDMGLDFFAATPRLWLRAALVIPAEFRLGHQLWDTWMMDFLNRAAGKRCYDITRAKCIFHPRHEGRRFVFKVDGWKPIKGFFGVPRQKLQEVNNLAKTDAK